MHAAPAIAMLGLLCLVGFTGGGCGGSGGGVAVSSKPKSTGSLRSVTAKMTVKTPPGASEEDTSAPTPPSPLSAGSSAPLLRPKPAEVKKGPRPKDVADWKGDDYESALRDGNPQLVAALEYYGPHFAGKESAANFLAKLLESAADLPAGSASPAVRSLYGARGPYPGQGRVNFNQAAIAALGVNGTPRARQILEAIVAGAFTAADKQARLAALKTLTADRGPEIDDLLLRLVTAPERAEMDQRAAKDSESIRLAALELIRARSSESLSLRLAKAMLAAEMPKTFRDQLWSCLREPRAENVAAQIMLYQSDRPDPATRSWLEQSVLAYSSDALGRLLGFPATEPRPARYVPGGGLSTVIPASQPRGVPPGGAAPLNPSRAAELLWSSNLAAVTERRLAELDNLAAGLPLITLAATLPNAAVRAALLRALERHWGEGPKPLLALARTDALNAEPGLVVLLKGLPRNDAPGVLARSHGNHFGAARTAKRLPGLDVHEAQKNAEVLEARRRREQLGQEWLELSRAVVQATCRRCYAAARAADNRGAVTSDDAGLPFRLDQGAQVRAVYQVNWPAALDGKLTGAPLLRLHYARIEEKASPAKVLAYYRRQLPHAKEHPLGGDAWIDGITSHGEKGHASSVDVLVAKLQSAVGGAPNDKVELIVEILSVECDGITPENLHPVNH
jgi:hypothetical protein